MLLDLCSSDVIAFLREFVQDLGELTLPEKLTYENLQNW